MLYFQGLLWKFNQKLCFWLLSTHFRLRLETGRADSGRSYQSKCPQHSKATVYFGGLFIFRTRSVYESSRVVLNGPRFGARLIIDPVARTVDNEKVEMSVAPQR